MGKKTFASMNIAVIGKCGKASLLAESLARAGHLVVIGLSEREDDDILVSSELDNIYFDSVEGAAAQAEVIFLALPSDQVREASYYLGDVRDKVIIDISGNIDPKNENYVYTLKAMRSITGAQHIVKAYNLAPIFEKDGNDVFFAGDSMKAKAVARILANDMGFTNTHDFGGHENLPVLEEMVRFYHTLSGRKGAAAAKFAFKIILK